MTGEIEFLREQIVALRRVAHMARGEKPGFLLHKGRKKA